MALVAMGDSYAIRLVGRVFYDARLRRIKMAPRTSPRVLDMLETGWYAGQSDRSDGNRMALG